MSEIYKPSQVINGDETTNEKEIFEYNFEQP